MAHIKCPECGDDDALTKVSGVVSRLIVDHPGMSSPDIVFQLGAPARPESPPGPVVATILILIVAAVVFVIAAILVGVMVAVLSAVIPIFARTEVFLAAFVVGVPVLIALFVSVRMWLGFADDRRNYPRALAEHKTACDRWENSYYCSKHDIVVCPKYLSVVRPHDYDFRLWCSYGDPRYAQPLPDS